MSHVWRLCHPIAGVSAVVIDKAYQGQEGHSSEEDRELCANSAKEAEMVVAHSMLMHHGVGELRPMPGSLRSRGSVPWNEVLWLNERRCEVG